MLAMKNATKNHLLHIGNTLIDSNEEMILAKIAITLEFTLITYIF